MSDLIDRQAEYTEQDMRNAFSAGYDYGIEAARHEIIRCKNCKHWEQESICDGYCSEIEKGGFDEDHFCSYAERREE